MHGFAILAASALAATALGTWSAAPSAAQPTACSPGPHKIKLAGQDAIKFCGSAKATVHVGSKALDYAGGHCQTLSGYFTVNLGISVGPTFKGKKPDYLGLTAGKAKAGTQASSIALAVRFGGKTYAVGGSTLKLASGLKKGTFSGTVLFTHTKVTGSFTC